jgi:predicted DNA-binding transcriptional regulator AlpA
MLQDQANQTSGTSSFGDALLDAIRQIVREEVKAAGTKHESNEDRLLTADEAAEMLAVSSDWLYRHAKKLPFTRKLGPKMLRFSHRGLAKWSESRKLN